MNPLEVKGLRLKIAFIVAAVVPVVVLPLLTPYVSIWKIGKIPLNPSQMLYVVLSSEIVLAVYMWGVGNWSRFEPPQNASGSAARQAAEPPPGQPTTGVSAQESAPPPAQKGGD